MKRKISALLAADIVGYSALIAEDEEDTVRHLAVFRSTFEDLAARHDGRVVNAVGDAVLAEFPSCVDAVRCALDLQESLRIRNLAYPPNRSINVRIGITLADIIDREGQLFGDGVNRAARLEQLAPPGGICISHTVQEQIAGKVTVKFADIGWRKVKNIPSPIHAYIVAPTAINRQHAASSGNRKRKMRRIMTGAAAVCAMLVAAVLVTQRGEVGQGSGAFDLPPQPAPGRRPSVEPASQAVPRERPCIDIRTACEQAGFARGGVREGNGVFADCVTPIMRGTPQPQRANKTLPQIDPQIVIACRTQNPNFGEVGSR
jgi:class 3 adenylate cyclase